MNEKLSRREFFYRLSAVAVGIFGGGSLLTACGGGQNNTPDTSAQQNQRKVQSNTMPDQVVDDPCNDLSGLSDTELATRQTFEYVASSPDPAKLCNNCAFWTPELPGEACGGCKVIKGPIHPKGYCKSWAPMPPKQQ